MSENLGNECANRSEELSNVIIGSAIEVHRVLGGPGLLESVYETALAHELTLRGLKVDRQVSVPVIYKGCVIDNPLRADLVVENLVIVECKATENYNPIFASQLLTYLRLKNLYLGLVLNFGEACLKKGIKRVVNGAPS